MANSTEVLTVEKITQYGVKANGQNYSYSKFCKKEQELKVGDVVEAGVYVGQKGGRYLNSYTVTGQTVAAPKATTPALPPTSVSETKAPMGVPPVAPAKKRTEVTSDPDKMTKADWSAKDIAIERVAIVKSVLESGAFAQLSVGRRLEDVLATGDAMIDHFVAKLNSMK